MTSDERDLHVVEPAPIEALAPAVDSVAGDPAVDSAAGEPDPRPGAAPEAGTARLPEAGTARLPEAGTARLPEADASLLALVDRLAVLLERSDLTELEVESGGTAILLRKAAAFAAALPAAASAPEAAPGARLLDPPGAPAAGGAAHVSAASAGTPASAREAVLAPLTGIFYASPSPGSPPFVAVGREVAVGQVIGLIEAMKLFNEIKSDRTGRVVRVIPENGSLVKAKHPLIEVEPL